MAESRVGLVVGFGHVTGRELAQACTDLIHDTRWEPGFDMVWDSTSAAAVDVSPDEVELLIAFAHEFADQIGTSRCVFVTTRDGIQALIRLFELRTRDLGRTYRTVRTVAEAAEWLGLPPGTIDVEAGVGAGG